MSNKDKKINRKPYKATYEESQRKLAKTKRELKKALNPDAPSEEPRNLMEMIEAVENKAHADVQDILQKCYNTTGRVYCPSITVSQEGLATRSYRVRHME